MERAPLNLAAQPRSIVNLERRSARSTSWRRSTTPVILWNKIARRAIEKWPAGSIRWVCFPQNRPGKILDAELQRIGTYAGPARGTVRALAARFGFATLLPEFFELKAARFY